MEKKNQSNSLGRWRDALSFRSLILWIGVFGACYVAVLPMSGTIALRNIALLGLLACLTYSFLKHRPNTIWPVPVLMWAAYLLVFPLISDSPSIAIESLLGQWGRGLLAMVVGAGVGSLLYKKNYDSAFYLGLVSSIPILIHLFLFAWRTWETSSVPWGYWGRETHHADLGYAAGQAVVLLTAALAVGRPVYRPWAGALIVACLVSTAFAFSRAGFAFSVFGGLTAVSCVYATQATHQRKRIFAGLVSLLIVVAAVLSIAVKEDPRWRNMTGQLLAGFSGDAIQISCEGTSSIESKIIAEYGPGEQAQRVISAVQGGDGARMVLLRAGIALAIKHPWGNDGSRQAYQKLLKSECVDPVILMAHTHNGWIDTILALGWIGAILYLIVLAYFFTLGYSALRRSSRLNEWAVVLVALSAFWIFRGFTDSVFRDHMLEMQGFVLAYAAMNLIQERNSASDATSSSRREKEKIGKTHLKQ